MLKRLTYFNLLYGTCWFVLALKGTYTSILTLVAITIVLLFNWVTLKEIEGLKVTTDKNHTTLRILTFLVSSVTLVNCVYLLTTDFNGKLKISGLTVLILLRMVFVAAVSFHTIKSRQIKLTE